MRRTSFAAFAVAAIMLTFAALPALAQSAGGDMPLRTPDGHPDISGTFTFRTLTPMQRPAQFEGLETLGPEAAAAFEASERTRQNRDLFDPETGAPNAGYQSRADGGVLSYNEFWYERGIELTSDKRTSLIVDPPDGRYPPLTDTARQADRERAAYRREHMYDSYENRSTGDRCIVFTKSGPPMRSGAYNNNLMIFQTADHVAILTEQARQARIIPLVDTEKPLVEQWGRRVARALGGGDAGRRDHAVPRLGQRKERPERAPDRTADAARSRYRRLRVHGDGPGEVHRTLYGHDAVPASGRRDLRVRLPRGQHRAVRHPRRRAATRARRARSCVPDRRTAAATVTRSEDSA